MASPGRGFHWSRPTGFTILQSLTGGFTCAGGINNLGNIARSSAYIGNSQLYAVLWNDPLSYPQDLGTLSGYDTSVGNGINNLGQVVGFSSK